MIAYTIIILFTWFACILGPIFFAIGLPTDQNESHSEHHFLKG